MWDPADASAAQDPDQYSDPQVYRDTYGSMLEKTAGNIPMGLSAAIYTQLTDVEKEVKRRCNSNLENAFPFIPFQYCRPGLLLKQAGRVWSLNVLDTCIQHTAS